MELNRAAEIAKGIKLVASDLDGTLIHNGGPVSSRSIAAIRALRKNGVFFTLCTGRDYFSLQQYIDKLELTGPVVVSGGSKIVEAQTGKTIWSQTIEREPLRLLLQAMNDYGMSYFVEDGTRWWVARGSHADIWAVITRLKLLAVGHKAPQIKRFNPRESFGEIFESEPTKLVAFIYNDKDLEFIEAAVKKSGLEGKNSGAHSYDISPKGVSKATGLCQLASSLGLEQNQCAAFGDYYNDVEMLKSAGLSFAMENAVDEAKKAADIVIGDVKADGVACCLESVFLNDINSVL